MARRAGGGNITSEVIFRVLVIFLSIGLFLQFSLLFLPTMRKNEFDRGIETIMWEAETPTGSHGGNTNGGDILPDIHKLSHFLPLLKPLPALAIIEDTDDLAKGTLDGSRPTITGVAIVLQRFLFALKNTNEELAQNPGVNSKIVNPAFFNLVEEHLLRFDAQYRGKSIFPIREDDSIFISIAAFRDYLLGETLKDAFRKAKNPHKLFIGAVVQNCFGVATTCKTGVEVVGKTEDGKPLTKISDAPPDKNGIEEFCTDAEFQMYCDTGQIRALYMNDTESVGPAGARYFASKLWGGETYFMQIDAHLQFAQDWDDKYISEIKAAKAYPKSILSAYPPGFDDGELGVSNGYRLCKCNFAELDIIRIEAGKGYKGDEKAPSQIPFIAAGFFLARAEFLTDVPFDPLLPNLFMGEEIALSMRAWTAGWDMYAPRKNLIAHQYRPGSMGLPKFWESVGRAFGRPTISQNMETITMDRIKYMLEYPETTREMIAKKNHVYVLKDIEHYGMGTVRPREGYVKLTKIDFDTKKCPRIPWCNQGTLE